MGENGRGKFTVVGNEVRVTDPQQFVWDPQPSYRVQVFAQDQGGLITSAWFTITIAAA